MINDLLKKYNQKIILSLLEGDLDQEIKDRIIDELNFIDFEKIKAIYDDRNNLSEVADVSQYKEIKPIIKANLSENEIKKYTTLGTNSINNNEYAIVTMAGGQGTRLGFNGPKGCFKLIINGEVKSIFQILAEDIKRLNEKYDVKVKWYSKTSRDNNDETASFFENNNYFSLDKDSVKFFVQSELPMLLEDGNLVLKEDYSINLASDGNGSIYKSLLDSNLLDESIKWLCINNVDNILPICDDSIFLGACIDKNIEVGVKTSLKGDPEERVGVYALKDDRLNVIEYTELPEELRYKTNDDGELAFGEGNISKYLVSIDAFKKMANMNFNYHTAHKATNYIDENNNYITCDKPNAYKFEKFIFDGFKAFDRVLAFRVNKNEEFAPVKNKEGKDSPETAIKLYLDNH